MIRNRHTHVSARIGVSHLAKHKAEGLICLAGALNTLRLIARGIPDPVHHTELPRLWLHASAWLQIQEAQS